MHTEEKMNKYIQRTGIKSAERYRLMTDEIQEIYKMFKTGRAVDAIVLAFNYGRAKGYRMALKRGGQRYE